MKKVKRAVSVIMTAVLFLSVAAMTGTSSPWDPPVPGVRVSAAATFRDSVGHWADPYIRQLAGQGIVQGNPDGTYRPDAAMKRADFVLMLYRAAGSPAAGGNMNFRDVPARAYYYNAVKWAAAEEIAQGSHGRFSPEDAITREQAFTFVSRYLDRGGLVYDCELSALQPFSDRNRLSGYASRPTAELIELGIVEGISGRLEPKGLLTRGAMAKILCRTLEKEKG